MSCEYGLIPCPNNCGQQLTRLAMHDHVSEECERRIVCCEYCDIKVVYKLFDNHRDMCARFPLECPNVCPAGTIPREELQNHLENVCPNSIIKCSFREFGCMFEVHTIIRQRCFKL